MSDKTKTPEAGSRFLRLTLKRGWFEMVERGEKKEEYREASAWINSRVNASKQYDAVEFRNGYRPDSPKVLVEYLGFRFGPGKPEWGACQGVNYVVIRLGRLLTADPESKPAAAEQDSGKGLDETPCSTFEAHKEETAKDLESLIEMLTQLAAEVRDGNMKKWEEFWYEGGTEEDDAKIFAIRDMMLLRYAHREESIESNAEPEFSPKSELSPPPGSVCGYHISPSEDCTNKAEKLIRYPLNKRWMPACSKHARIAKAFGWLEKSPNAQGEAQPPAKNL